MPRSLLPQFCGAGNPQPERARRGTGLRRPHGEARQEGAGTAASFPIQNGARGAAASSHPPDQSLRGAEGPGPGPGAALRGRGALTAGAVRRRMLSPSESRLTRRRRGARRDPALAAEAAAAAKGVSEGPGGLRLPFQQRRDRGHSPSSSGLVSGQSEPSELKDSEEILRRDMMPGGGGGSARLSAGSGGAERSGRGGDLLAWPRVPLGGRRRRRRRPEPAPLGAAARLRAPPRLAGERGCCAAPRRAGRL